MEIKSFDFRYSDGYYMNANVKYMLKHEEGKYVASFKPLGVPMEEAESKEVDEHFSKKIQDAIDTFKVKKWDGFQKSNPHVFDGDSFDLSIYFEDKTEIHAHGYMEWPKHYREFLQEIKQIYAEIFDNELPKGEGKF